MIINDQKIKLSLFLGVLIFQLTIASGHLYSFDEVVLLETAAEIVEKGSSSLTATPEILLYSVPGVSGGLYSKFGIGGSALVIPFYLVGKSMGLALGLGDTRSFAEFISSFANAFVIAAIAVAFWSTLRRLAISERASFITTLLLVFSTTLTVYGRGLFADAPTALAMLLAFSMHVSGRHLLSGTATAAALSFRLEFALAAGIYPLFTKFRNWIRLIAPMVTVLLLLGLYNYVRFGNPLNQGQLEGDQYDTFSTPIPLGLFGLFLSFGKGLIWYSPPIWLAAAGAAAFYKTHRRLAWLIILINLPLILLHAHWHSWMGGWSYGPRRLVASLPLLMIPAAFCTERLLATRRGKAVLWTIGILGFLAQIGGLSVNFMDFIRSRSSFGDTLWTIEHSAMIGQVRYLLETGEIDIWYFQLLGNSPLTAAMLIAGLLFTFGIITSSWKRANSRSRSPAVKKRLP